MKTRIRILAAALLCGSAFALAAQDAPPPETSPEDAAQAADVQVEGKTDAVTERFCLRETGSRIPVASRVGSSRERRDCMGANGRVYTREDIEQTGSVDLAEALRRLDPSIR